MASSRCWRCLLQAPARPYAPSVIPEFSSQATNALNRAAFSTTPSMAAKAQKVVAQRGKKTNFQMKKKTVTRTGRPPAPGERKAMRKRVVLSNTNALEVADLQDLEAEKLADEALKAQVVGLPGPLVDQLRAVEAFKHNQGWSLFRRPAMLVRNETLELAKQLLEAENAKGEKLFRRTYTGERGSGKSLMLLQGTAMAFLRGWIVVNIPEANDITFGTAEYGPLPNSDPQQYIQPAYIANMLAQTAKANNVVLSNMTLSQKHRLPIPVQDNMSLARLAELGSRDPALAWPVFQALWTELTSTTVPRPPILLCIDGLDHMMRVSGYRSPSYEQVHAHDLAVVDHFVKYLSGSQKLPNGGAVLTAISESNRAPTPTLSIYLQQAEARIFGKDPPRQDPYQVLDERVLHAMDGVDIFPLKGLTREEARGLIEYWARSGMVRARVDEGFVGERWTLAGNGIVGELERGTVRLRI